jgi:hypothetical protein
VVGLLHLAFEQACFGKAFPPNKVKFHKAKIMYQIIDSGGGGGGEYVMMMMMMTTTIMLITYCNNNFNEKYWAIFDPKLSRLLRDLNDQETNVPMLQIPNLSIIRILIRSYGNPDYGHGVCLLKHFVFEPP